MPLVRVEAAAEELLVARSDDPFTLLRAAYHLGNRHVALELGLGELRLLQDPVLADLLRGLGVSLEAITAPFAPESGAYTAGHSHSHTHGHSHGHGHSSGEASGPDHDAASGSPARHHGHGSGARKGDPGEHHHPHRH
jgi:urease accessory protein